MKRHFLCSTPRADLRIPRPCPNGYWIYKDKCLWVGSDKLEFNDAQARCASRGAIILPIKDRGTYQFVRSLAKQKRYEDMFIGMNFSTHLENPLYSDGSIFNRSTHFVFDSEAEKFGGKECVYLKKGVTYKPRSTHCNETMQFICLWRSKYKITVIIENKMSLLEPSCPKNFVHFPKEEDGRTCYGPASLLSQERGASSSIKKKCQSFSNNLVRPALPSSITLLPLLKQRYKAT